MTTDQFDVLFNNFKLKKCKWQTTISYNKKSDGKHRLSIMFSYVVTIYQIWSNDNTLDVLFTSYAINILLFVD
jgi:hypothetical protein